MSFSPEQAGYQPPEPKDRKPGDDSREDSSEEFYDSELYIRFKEINDDAHIDLARIKDGKQLREQFFSQPEDERENPELEYPHLSLEHLEERREMLRAFKKETRLPINTEHLSEEEIIVRQLYRWKINEKLAEVEMGIAAHNKDMRKFQRYNEFIFGKPSPRVFAYELSTLHKDLNQHLDSDNPEIVRIAQELQAVLPEKVADMTPEEIREAETPLSGFLFSNRDIMEEMGEVTSPDQETFEYVRKVSMEELEHMITLPEGKDVLDAQDFRDIFRQSLDAVGATEKGWDVIIDPGLDFFRVMQREKRVGVPAEKRESFSTAAPFIVHEIGTHVARALGKQLAPGQKNLMLLRIGLDRYIQGEEGVATMREQAVRGKIDQYAGEKGGHFASSLVYGLDGQPRDFRDTYRIMEKFHQFRLMEDMLKSGKELDEDGLEQLRTKTQTESWNRTVRTFRGADGKTPGVCSNQGLSYRKGNIGAYLRMKKSPDEMYRLQVGKYNPLTERHIDALDKLGITFENFAVQMLPGATDEEIQSLEHPSKGH